MFTPEVKSQPNEDISILVRKENHSWNYICECGDASGLTLKECQNTRGIFLSHTHIDHFVNFDNIFRHQLGTERTIIVCGPKGIAEQVQCRIKSYTWNLIQEGSVAYELREIISEEQIKRYRILPPSWELEPLEDISGNKILEDKDFYVEFTILDHKTPSIAYRFKEQDTVKINMKDAPFKGGKWVRELKEAYESGNDALPIEIQGETHLSGDLFSLLEIKIGDSLGIIMDHAATLENHSKIKALFEDCRKVYIECFYKAGDKAFAEANFHSYSTESGKIMQACQVKEAIPVHFSRKYDENDLEQILTEFNEAYQGTS